MPGTIIEQYKATEAVAGADLPERLGPRGLDYWLEVFGRDLAAC
jgi:hypothetical protein